MIRCDSGAHKDGWIWRVGVRFEAAMQGRSAEGKMRHRGDDFGTRIHWPEDWMHLGTGRLDVAWRQWDEGVLHSYGSRSWSSASLSGKDVSATSHPRHHSHSRRRKGWCRRQRSGKGSAKTGWQRRARSPTGNHGVDLLKPGSTAILRNAKIDMLRAR